MSERVATTNSEVKDAAAGGAAATDLADAYCNDKGIKGMSASSKQIMNGFLALFNEADVNNSGELEVGEIRKLCEDNRMFSRGYDFTMRKMDVDDSESITKDEFLHLFLICWGTHEYGVSRFKDMKTATPDEIVDIMKEDGYDEATIRNFIEEQNLIGDCGSVEVETFLENFFNVLKRC